MGTRNLLQVGLCASFALLSMGAAGADPIVTNSSSSSRSSSETVEVKRGVRLKFRERLSNLMEQINLGLSKGWIPADQGAAFKAEHDRLLSGVDAAEKAGWPESQVDTLEKGVTALNAAVSSASTKGSEPKPAPNTSTEPAAGSGTAGGAATKSTTTTATKAGGKPVTKTKTHTKTTKAFRPK